MSPPCYLLQAGAPRAEECPVELKRVTRGRAFPGLKNANYLRLTGVTDAGGHPAPLWDHFWDTSRKRAYSQFGDVYLIPST